uniref:Uncharacterized LOC103671065 n=1 Tax=Ursus maritimus TaxID=29073 RepID=A0A452TME9_URSMA
MQPSSLKIQTAETDVIGEIHKPTDLVPLPGAEPNCGPEEYKPDGLGLCCRKCPAGFHVSRHCGVNHGMPICDPCEPGSFLTYPNGETSCQPCAKCREDQEMVAVCTRTSNQKCQCKTGSFYCDSPDCTESCYRCRRCSGATLRPCNATSDTVCDTEPGPEAPDFTERTPEQCGARGSDSLRGPKSTGSL